MKLRLGRYVLFSLLITFVALSYQNISRAQKTVAEKSSMPKFSSAKFCLRDTHTAQTLHLQIAKTPEQLAYGLMFRKTIKPYDGMLFLFDTPQIIHMWMKDTPHPLDIVFLDASRKIVEISRNAVPYSLAVISTQYLVMSAIELEAGRAEHSPITIGAQLSDGVCGVSPAYR